MPKSILISEPEAKALHKLLLNTESSQKDTELEQLEQYLNCRYERTLKCV